MINLINEDEDDTIFEIDGDDYDKELDNVDIHTDVSMQECDSLKLLKHSDKILNLNDYYFFHSKKMEYMF